MTSKTETRGGRQYLPYAFTEQGVAMLSAVLKSDTAVLTSIMIIDAFVAFRRFLQNAKQCFAFEIMDSSWIQEIMRNL